MSNSGDVILWLVSVGTLLYLGCVLASAIGITRAVQRAGRDLPRVRRASFALLYGTISVFIGAVAALIIIGLARTL